MAYKLQRVSFNASGGIDGVDFIDVPVGGNAAWGGITGTLSSQTDLQNALNAKAASSSLATVATSGAYADLSGKPTLGSAAASNTSAFATAAQGTKADTALQANPDIGTATGASVAVTGAVTSSGTAGIGYASGAGGAVTQATNKSTGVTLNKICGEITMNGAALAAATIVSFTLTNSTIAAKDVLVMNHVTTGTRGAYGLNAQAAAGSAVIYVRNNSAGSLSEAIVIRYAVIKAVAA